MFFKIMLLALCALYMAPNGSASPMDVKLSRSARATDTIKAIIARVQANAKAQRDHCHDNYAKEMNDVSLELQQSYEVCKTIAEDAQARLITDSNKLVAELEQQLKDTRAALAACNSVEDMLMRFECFASEGTKHWQILSALASNAANAVAQNADKVAEIQNENMICNTAAERIYVVKAIEANEKRTICLSETNQPITEDPISGGTVTQEPSTEAAITDAPVTVEPITVAPITDEPITEELITEAPTTDEPITDEPITVEPITDEPITEAPITDAPITDAPITEAPITDTPITVTPITESPITEAPVTDAPITEAPITPVTELPSTPKQPGENSKESKESKEDTNEESNEEEKSKESKESKEKDSNESKKKDSNES